jgi:hypothetical protein
MIAICHQGRTEVRSTLPVNTLPDQNQHHAHSVVPRPYAQGQQRNQTSITTN